MRITESQLRRLIAREVRSALREADEAPETPEKKVTSSDLKKDKMTSKGQANLQALASDIEVPVDTIKAGIKAALSGDTSKSAEMAQIIRGLVKSEPAGSKDAGIQFAKMAALRKGKPEAEKTESLRRVARGSLSEGSRNLSLRFLLEDYDLDTDSTAIDPRSFKNESILLEAASFKSSSVEELQKKWPKLHEYIQLKFSKYLPNASVAIKKSGLLSRGEPYVLIPDSSGTIVYWDTDSDRLAFSSSVSLAQDIKNAK